MCGGRFGRRGGFGPVVVFVFVSGGLKRVRGGGITLRINHDT